jgi:hypothetical protein
VASVPLVSGSETLRTSGGRPLALAPHSGQNGKLDVGEAIRGGAVWNRLLSTPRRRRVMLVVEAALVAGASVLFAYTSHATRVAHTARAQSQRDCSLSTGNTCPEGAICETVQGVGRCAGAFEDASALWAEAHDWVGRRVVVRHARIVPASYSCTLMYCGTKCCNYCQGPARPIGTGFRELAGIECLGNECEKPTCGVIRGNGFWALPDRVELRARVREDPSGLSLEELDLDALFHRPTH